MSKILTVDEMNALQLLYQVFGDDWRDELRRSWHDGVYRGYDTVTIGLLENVRRKIGAAGLDGIQFVPSHLQAS